MGNNDRALLLLLRMAVREEVVDLPADIDWREIKERAFRQGVGGIVFDVVEKLPAGQRPPKEVVLEWMGMVMRMERMYEHHRQVIVGLAAFYAEMGVRMLLLKGYGLSLAWACAEASPDGGYRHLSLWQTAGGGRAVAGAVWGGDRQLAPQALGVSTEADDGGESL